MKGEETRLPTIARSPSSSSSSAPYSSLPLTAAVPPSKQPCLPIRVTHRPRVLAEGDPVMVRLAKELMPSKKSLFVVSLRSGEGDDQEVSEKYKNTHDSNTVPYTLQIVPGTSKLIKGNRQGINLRARRQHVAPPHPVLPEGKISRVLHAYVDYAS